MTFGVMMGGRAMCQCVTIDFLTVRVLGQGTATSQSVTIDCLTFSVKAGEKQHVSV